MLEKKVLKFIKRQSLFTTLDSLVIGVSGGPDSLALLYLLNGLKLELGITIVVAHLNHGLRGRSSDSDQEFVKKTATSLGLIFETKKLKKLSVRSKFPSEEVLRKSRHEYLFGIAKKYKTKKIVLAHTLDDQAETVLMRLVRGSGLHGLISILPVRELNSFEIIRPMLEVSRSEIVEYLRKIRIKPRIDRSNYSNVFLRNRIRNKILKDLSKINPSIKESLARFAQQAAIDYDYICCQASRYVKVKQASRISVDLLSFVKLHEALQRMVIRIALERLTGDLRTFTNKHWKEVRDLIFCRPAGSVVDLTKGIKIKKFAQKIDICLPNKLNCN
ncbi:tRNA lysidine(34) synthetase TilS [Thermoproteota archaeon]